MLISKTLDECFAELIVRRGWWKNSPYERKTASLHKRMFLAGKLYDEIKRIYLQNANYELVQKELWRKEE